MGLLFLAMGCVEYYPAVKMQSAVLLPQCSAQSSAFEAVSSQATTDKITFGYGTCEFSPDGGFIADPNASVPSDLLNMEVPFGKSFDVIPLNAVLSASARSTWTYIQENFDVEVYRMPPINPQGCLLFQELDVAPSNVRCVFDDHATAALSDNNEVFGSRGILQGLYWAAGYINSATQAYSPARAIIYVRTDATRWTLVHEFVHHLFREQRIRDGVPVYTPEMASDARAALAKELEYQQSASHISSQDLQRLVVQAEQVTRLGMGSLLQNELEEATIEYILFNLYRNRLLTYTRSNAGSSVDYVHVTVNKAKQQGAYILDLLARTKQHLQTNGGSSSQLSQIETLSFQVIDLMDQAQSVSNDLL